MTPDPNAASRPSSVPRKRPLAKRSCLRCREKKARCELPDVYVDSSKVPLPIDKQCHRCTVLAIDCVVWDGDRKRKPKLDPRGSTQVNASSYSRSSSAQASPEAAKLTRGEQQQRDHATTSEQVTLRHRSDSGSSSGPSQSEQLAASEVSHAQQILLSRPKAWKAMSRTLHALIERLQRERRYSQYLKLRIDAPPSTPDMVSFLPSDRMGALDLQLRDYLVGHPYLPSLSTLHQDQASHPTRPRALLLATMTLLALKGIEDELISTDVRTLSSYIDRLGTQLLFSAPRDIHLAMAFELLLAHEPGLVGTAASQFEPEGRGLGLASENLLTCAVKVAREVGLDDAATQTAEPATRLAHMSLWCCLRAWEGIYAFLGEKITVPPDLNKRFASTVREILFSKDDDGNDLPSAPRLQDASGPTAKSFHEMREFCTNLENQLGRDGVLRSAGRSVLCMRIESTCALFSSLQELQETLASTMPTEDRYERITEISRKAQDDILMVRHLSNEHLGLYAGQRLVRVWEQLIHAECAFFCIIFGTYATSALFSGKIEGAVEPYELMRTICHHLGPHRHIGEVGLKSNEFGHLLLATVPQMDRQPSRRRQDQATSQVTSRYLHRLPTLLVCAMTVHAARRRLETVAFGLVAFAHAPHDTIMSVTLMEAAAHALRQLSPACSIHTVDTVAQVSANYIEEMIETARLWQIYYRVYRPVASIGLHPPTEGKPSNNKASQNNPANSAASSTPQRASAMDFLADAAAAQVPGSAHSATSDHRRPSEAADTGGSVSSHSSMMTGSAAASMDSLGMAWNAQAMGYPSFGSSASSATPMSSHAGLLDATIFDANISFDLDAFLRDVDQLF